ncbi:MAG: hypothetical protein AAGF31_02945 [Planctomycetota bacterium]
MNRRHFAISLGLGVAGFASRVGASPLDKLATEVIRAAVDGAEFKPDAIKPARVVEHWRAATNSSWQWLERSELVAGEWSLTGITQPVHRETGEPVDGRDDVDYLTASAAPAGLLTAIEGGADDYCIAVEGADAGPAATPLRRARHGRPASHWLRNLNASELRAWLASLEPPQADVAGMTYLEHLTRDHGFDTLYVAMLTEVEQAKLHGAAHHGY